MTAADLTAIGPALILAGAALIATILAIPRRTGARPLAWGSAAAGVAAAAQILVAGTNARDGAGVFFTVLVTLGTAAGLVLAASDPRPAARSKAEAGLALFAGCGAVVVVSATDLVVLFTGLALLTVPLYVLTGRRAASLDDGAVRHLTLGATGTATALYGIALLYAATGETGYAGVGRATHNPLYLAGLGLALAGLASHVVIARGHRWAILIDIAIVGAVLRLVVATAAGEAALDWQVSLASLAAVAFVAPVLAAIGERRVRRLVGYATASQLGYVAAAAAGAALPAAAFALTTQAVLAVGLFAIVAILPAPEPTVADLAGLARRRPLVVLALAALVLGVIGLPPTAGFVAKVFVLEAAVHGQLLWLAFVAVFATVAGAAVYARLVLACLSAPRLDAVAPPRMRVGTVVALLAGIAILAAGLVPGPLLEVAQTVRF